ncbi:MAG: glycine zipper domain-containing protein [Verrucomicrobiales bacterium]
MKIRAFSITAAAITSLTLVGCEGMNNQTSGTLGGAATGALVGGIAGNNIDGISKTEGAIAGALVGGLLGNTMGRQQDQINAIDARTNYMTVSVRNSNGSVTPVQLSRVQGDIWRGPRGEQYNGVPSEGQLRQLYGF